MFAEIIQVFTIILNMEGNKENLHLCFAFFYIYTATCAFVFGKKKKNPDIRCVINLQIHEHGIARDAAAHLVLFMSNR